MFRAAAVEPRRSGARLLCFHERQRYQARHDRAAVSNDPEGRLHNGGRGTTYVQAGTYRETVTPARSGTATSSITFLPYGGESVTISGADVLPASSWTVSSGQIYQ